MLVGAPPPVTFFAYPDKPSWVTPEGCDLLTLAEARDDAIGALEALGGCAGRANSRAALVKRVMPDMPAAWRAGSRSAWARSWRG